MQRVRHLSKTFSAHVLDQALAASFGGCRHCDPPVRLDDNLARLRAGYHSACPVPDAELKLIAARYAAVHSITLSVRLSTSGARQ